MTNLERYFDNAATTPVDPRVVQAMLPYLEDSCGNPHSQHSFGARAREAVERAREQVAALIGAESPEQVVFTSGATESNNWVLRSFASGAVSPFEHSSVREPASMLGYMVLRNEGYRVLPPEGPVDLVSQMRVNNEIGTVFEPASVSVSGAALHSDLTQAIGKIPVNVMELGVEFASFSAHKIHGPKGVGGLFLKDPASLRPLLIGGGQESGLRAGTLNVPGIVGFGEAARIARDSLESDSENAWRCRSAVLGELSRVSDMEVNGGEWVSPFILSLSFAGIEGEALVLEVDAAGFAISSGAACSSGSTEPSHVLTALGIAPEWLRGTIRISFGRYSTVAASAALARELSRAVGTLRSLKV